MKLNDTSTVGPPPAGLKALPVISGNLRPYQIEPLAEIHESGLPAGMADATKPRSLAEWERDLDDEAAIGFNLLWISHVSSALDAPGDPLGGLLDLCAHRRVQVILAIDFTPNWYEVLDPDQELRTVGPTARILGERYGNHPAFFAWYVPHEVYVTWGPMRDYVDDLYARLVDLCRHAAADKPVTLSPFFILDRDKVFGDYNYAAPEEYYRYWSRLIRHSGFDTIMLQDSGEHFSYVTMEQRRPFFAAMKAACAEGDARLWGNVETAEYVCPSIEKYVHRYGRVHHSTVKDLPWRAVPIDRLEQKLRLAAEFCERIVSWGYFQFGRPHLGPEASTWYGDYQGYWRRVTREA